MKARTPIEAMIDAVVSCSRCGTKGVGNCHCWDKKAAIPKPQKKWHRSKYHVAIHIVACNCCGAKVGECCHPTVDGKTYSIPVHRSRVADARKLSGAVDAYETGEPQKP